MFRQGTGTEDTVCTPCPWDRAYMQSECKQILLNKLVKTPLKSFAKLLGKDGDLPGHESNKYHKKAEAMACDFLRVLTSKTKLL